MKVALIHIPCSTTLPQWCLKRKRIVRNVVIDDLSTSDFGRRGTRVGGRGRRGESKQAKKRSRQKRCEFIGWASKELLGFLNSLKRTERSL